jgi:polysaccharide deacetylase family protein (PEP-CTERM system associated)
MAEILFSLDLEDHTDRYDESSRYPAQTTRLLDFCKERGIKGTIFTVARMAEYQPNLLRRARDDGHEIACHSYDHTLLTHQTPEQFRAKTKEAKDKLEQAMGAAIIGYRAPMFSLVPETNWALDIIQELGFTYSSSVMPIKTPVSGWAGISATPFRWPNGLIEFPVPVANIGGKRVPYLGGIYMRYAPMALIRHFIQQAPQGSVLWTYCHPYDFDAEEKFYRFPDVPLWGSLLLHFNRRKTFAKLAEILSPAPHKRFCDYAADMASR